MSLDPRRLLVFRTIARAGSLSAAARELGWTQPAVSQQLQRLEREAGCPLLLRGVRGVTLTEPGRVLLGRADTVAGELRMAGEELAALADLDGGRVRLAAFPSAAAVIAPAAIGDLARRHPRLAVTMTEAEPPEAMAAVRADESDLALVFGHGGPPADRADLTWVPLLREPLRLVLPTGHRLAGRRTADLAELAEDPWIAGCPRCRGHLVERAEAAGFSPRIRYESDDYVMVQNLVAQDLGVTMLPRSALVAFSHPGVAIRPAPGLGRRHVGLAHRPGAEQVPAVAALMRALVEAAAA